MAYERKKLLAMIQSPVVDKFGDWRYFVTFAPAESYDQRLFDVASNYTMMNAPYGEDERYPLQTPNVEKFERNDVLAKHPALLARLFDLKQHALWECVLQGKHQPMGEVVDFWKRAEVGHIWTILHFSLSLSFGLCVYIYMCVYVCVCVYMHGRDPKPTGTAIAAARSRWLRAEPGHQGRSWVLASRLYRYLSPR
jgi:hypothetical protein